jgi:hypothetical protein
MRSESCAAVARSPSSSSDELKPQAIAGCSPVAARGANIFAHIVGLLEGHAGLRDADVDVPDLANVNVAFLSGHDT